MSTLAEALSVQNKWAEALDVFESLLRVASPAGEPSNQVNAGAALLQLGRRQEAAGRFRRAIEVLDASSTGGGATGDAQRRVTREKARVGLSAAAGGGTSGRTRRPSNQAAGRSAR